MTYLNFLLDSTKDMLAVVAGFVPTLVAVVATLIIGLVIARIVAGLIPRLVRETHLDKVAKSVGLDGALHRGGVKKTTGDILGSMSYWIIAIMFLIMAVKSLGLVAVDATLHTLFAYVPSVIAGVMALVFGMIIANFVSTIVKIVASNTDVPRPELLASLAKWSIVIFALGIFIRELGFGAILAGTTFHIMFAGIVFALALSYGLGGATAKYVTKLGK